MGVMRKSRLSKFKQDHLIEHFVAGTTARTAASLCGVNRKTAAFYFLRLREIIAIELEADGPPPKKWSTVIVSKRRIRNGEQTTQTRRNSDEVAAG